ncbi:hypothetical protein [Leptospira saintgironsiae]|uniref:DUF4785 domain-containing protein n=1 Tax=Leptospira saintgironsiae TaxID=2023183 RepID=A0A2M9YCI1_9LEPT|nr:hypothetical protein [Leptospira saintgironsiae]PJZ49274.1 hypothetical protein CH362_08015 [Leptospira saintgironsiae]
MKKTLFYILFTISFLSLGLYIFINDSENSNRIEISEKNPFYDPSLGAGTSGYSFWKEPDPDTIISDYKTWSEFPPDSRPLSRMDIDILEFRKIGVPPQIMPVKSGGNYKDSGFLCSLQPEYHSLVEGENMRIFLYCFRAGFSAKERLDLKSVRLEARAGAKKSNLDMDFGNDSGLSGDEISGDGTYTFLFRPRKEDWADMNLTVNFKIPSDSNSAEYSLSAAFFSSPVSPAKFVSNKFFDKIEEGSLEIFTEMDVKEPGEYTIQANLYGAGEPIGTSRKEIYLKQGRQTIGLEFFGRLFWRSRQSGPYVLKDLRAHLNTDVIQSDSLTGSQEEVDKFLSGIKDDKPKRKLVPYSTEEYTTKYYRLEEFAEKEYDSIDKRKRIAELESLKKNLGP